MAVRGQRPGGVGGDAAEPSLARPHARLVALHGEGFLQDEVHEAAGAAVAVEHGRGAAKVLHAIEGHRLADAPGVGAQAGSDRSSRERPDMCSLQPSICSTFDLDPRPTKGVVSPST